MAESRVGGSLKGWVTGAFSVIGDKYVGDPLL